MSFRPQPKPERKPKQRTKRKDQHKLYVELVKPAFMRGLAVGQGHGTARCQVCRKRPATEVHHKTGRIGGDLLDSRYFMGVCSPCHRRIHDNPEWAFAQGYLVSRLAWGHADGDEEAPEVGEHAAASG